MFERSHFHWVSLFFKRGRCVQFLRKLLYTFQGEKRGKKGSCHQNIRLKCKYAKYKKQESTNAFSKKTASKNIRDNYIKVTNRRNMRITRNLKFKRYMRVIHFSENCKNFVQLTIESPFYLFLTFLSRARLDSESLVRKYYRTFFSSPILSFSKNANYLITFLLASLLLAIFSYSFFLFLFFTHMSFSSKTFLQSQKIQRSSDSRKYIIIRLLNVTFIVKVSFFLYLISSFFLFLRICFSI